MCYPLRGRKSLGTGNCSCGCFNHGCGAIFRRFYSSQEELKLLEDYRDQLKNELEGVTASITELESK